MWRSCIMTAPYDLLPRAAAIPMTFGEPSGTLIMPSTTTISSEKSVQRSGRYELGVGALKYVWYDLALPTRRDNCEAQRRTGNMQRGPTDEAASPFAYQGQEKECFAKLSAARRDLARPRN